MCKTGGQNRTFWRLMYNNLRFLLLLLRQNRRCPELGKIFSQFNSYGQISIRPGLCITKIPSIALEINVCRCSDYNWHNSPMVIQVIAGVREQSQLIPVNHVIGINTNLRKSGIAVTARYPSLDVMVRFFKGMKSIKNVPSAWLPNFWNRWLRA